jgi:hypothetical protein
MMQMHHFLPLETGRRSRVGSEQPMARCVGDDLQPAVHAEFLEDALNVIPDRHFAYVQPVGQVPGAETAGQHRQDLALAPGERARLGHDPAYPSPLFNQTQEPPRARHVAKEVHREAAAPIEAGNPEGADIDPGGRASRSLLA